MSAVRCASNRGPARQTINELVIQLLQHYGISYPEASFKLCYTLWCWGKPVVLGTTAIGEHTYAQSTAACADLVEGSHPV
jgi:hypothetical protein